MNGPTLFELKIPQITDTARRNTYGLTDEKTVLVLMWRDGLFYPLFDDVFAQWLNDQKRDGIIFRTFIETGVNRRVNGDMFPPHISIWFESEEEAAYFKLKWL